MFDYSKVKDITFFKDHTLPAHSDHLWYPDTESLKAGENPLIFNLNGLWNFSYAVCEKDSVPDFYEASFDCHNWETIRVPAHIQMEGYDIPAYVNTQYPWDGREEIWDGEIPARYNPTASYVKYFTVPESMRHQPLFISFQGVESGFALWLNGHYVGYSEDSFTPSEFELTPYLSEGENKLAVKVFKWTSGSWAEDQDFYRFSGIFRDVFLYCTPATHIEDIKVTTLLSEDFSSGTLSMDLLVSGEGSISAALTLLPLYAVPHGMPKQIQDTLRETGAFFPELSVEPAKTDAPVSEGMMHISLAVSDVKLWSAEEPNLYEVLLTVKDASGNITEVITQPVGFRRFEIKDTLMLLNGKRIVFKGANRHEFTADAGRVPDLDALLLDLVTMKQNNINAIRTCHYPNDSMLYRLCDIFGLYLIDETNLETHGSWAAALQADDLSLVIPGDKPEWKAALTDRANSMLQRDKNHASVLIWSCGNESFGGSVIKAMSDFFHETDPTRPVHYEGIFHDRRYNDTSDMESQMYSTVAQIKDFLKEHRDKPFICCEYSHAMGNSCGSLYKYTELTDTEPLYQGGFIWDYIDQTLRKKNRYGEEFAAYGGDCYERPTDYNFSANGIVYGLDRKPSPKMQEVKFLYQNIEAAVTRNHVLIKNKSLFTSTDSFDCAVTLKRDGKFVCEAPLGTCVKPLSEKEYALPDSVTCPENRPAGEYAVTVSFRLKEDTIWGKRGHEVAFGQYAYQIDQPSSPEKKDSCDPDFTVIHGKANLGVRGKDFDVLFSYALGGLVSYRLKGVEMIAQMPKPNFWRAPVDNDMGWGIGVLCGQWKLASLYVDARDFAGQDYALFTPVIPEVKESRSSVTVTFTYHLPTVPKAQCKVDYEVFPDGTVGVTLSYDPVEGLPDLPEFGMIFKIPADYNQTEWYGLGPEETYADRKCGGKLGIYQKAVTETMADYIVPQETGNRSEVRWARVTDRKGHGFLLTAGKTPMNFSALPYTPHELENAAHPHELPPVHYTVIRTSLAQMGIGGDDSWGAKPHPEYRIPADKHLEFTFRFRGI